jgi:hypothetical protein
MFDFDPKSDARNVGPEILFPSGIRFQLVETADQSLTARLIYTASGTTSTSEPANTSETMHSLRGAFLETVYIYGKAYDTAIELLDQSINSSVEANRDPRVFSLGLGLGYVELLSSALSIRHGRKLCGASFEAVNELNSSFLHWLGLNGAASVPTHVYDGILERTSIETGVDAARIKLEIREAIQAGSWIIEGPLTAQLDSASLDSPFHCIAFDAFSGKSTPELWTREFLDAFLAKACAPICALSTYACTGHLKRALVASGFELTIREGYASKRDSTLATRR